MLYLLLKDLFLLHHYLPVLAQLLLKLFHLVKLNKSALSLVAQGLVSLLLPL